MLSNKFSSNSKSNFRYILTILIIQILTFSIIPLLPDFFSQNAPDFSTNIFDIYGLFYQLTLTFSQTLYTPIIKTQINEYFSNNERGSFNSSLGISMNIFMIMANSLLLAVYEITQDDLLDYESLF